MNYEQNKLKLAIKRQHRIQQSQGQPQSKQSVVFTEWIPGRSSGLTEWSWLKDFELGNLEGKHFVTKNLPTGIEALFSLISLLDIKPKYGN